MIVERKMQEGRWIEEVSVICDWCAELAVVTIEGIDATMPDLSGLVIPQLEALGWCSFRSDHIKGFDSFNLERELYHFHRMSCRVEFLKLAGFLRLARPGANMVKLRLRTTDFLPESMKRRCGDL